MATKSYNKRINDTTARIGECRLSYVSVFEKYAFDGDTENAAYQLTMLIPKTDEVAVDLINDCISEARSRGREKFGPKFGKKDEWFPLRDGDADYPDDENYAGMYYMKAKSKKRQPGLKVLDGGVLMDALDEDDIYSGCWGAVSVGFYPFSTRGNDGVAVSLNNVCKTRDDERLSGGARSADADFEDM